MSDSVDLTKAYQEAGAAILRSLHGDDVRTVKIRFEKTLQTVVTHLDVLQSNALGTAVSLGVSESQTTFRHALSTVFNGRAFTMKDLEAKGISPGNIRAAEAVLDHKQSDARNTATYRHNYLELRSGLVGVSQELKNKVNKVLGELANSAANTVRAATDELIKDLQHNGVFSIKYNNGATVGADNYAAMVCRSARTESANAENVRLADAFGTDLVECVGNAVTCEVCAKYRGRVFSMSGKDKRFPPLRDGLNSPLRNGYDLIHPNCRCQFVPYFEKFHSDEDNKAKRAFSNRPFEGDLRSERQKEAYQRWQALNRRASDERHRYEKMRAKLGEDMQYKSMASFRRAYRSSEDSFAYKKSHYALRDYRQYQHWKEYLPQDMMPKSLAHFQDLKYNEHETFQKKFLEFRTSEIRSKLGTKEFPLTVHLGRQGKHIRGAAEYIVGRSYLVVDDPEEGLKMAQEIVDKYHGTGGLRINPKSGVWYNQEVVKTDRIVGYSSDRNKQWVPTKAVKIHYSKYGTHIVPTIIGEE